MLGGLTILFLLIPALGWFGVRYYPRRVRRDAIEFAGPAPADPATPPPVVVVSPRRSWGVRIHRILRVVALTALLLLVGALAIGAIPEKSTFWTYMPNGGSWETTPQGEWMTQLLGPEWAEWSDWLIWIFLGLAIYVMIDTVTTHRSKVGSAAKRSFGKPMRLLLTAVLAIVVVRWLSDEDPVSSIWGTLTLIIALLVLIHQYDKGNWLVVIPATIAAGILIIPYVFWIGYNATPEDYRKGLEKKITIPTLPSFGDGMRADLNEKDEFAFLLKEENVVRVKFRFPRRDWCNSMEYFVEEEWKFDHLVTAPDEEILVRTKTGLTGRELRLSPAYSERYGTEGVPIIVRHYERKC